MLLQKCVFCSYSARICAIRNKVENEGCVVNEGCGFHSVIQMFMLTEGVSRA